MRLMLPTGARWWRRRSPKQAKGLRRGHVGALSHAGFALPVALLTLLVVAVFALAADVTATAVLRETAAFAEGIHAQNAARAGVAAALQSVRQASATGVACALPLLGQLDAESGFVAQVVCVQAAVYQIRSCGWTLGMGRATATVTYDAATNCIESWLCN
jgi:Tfp pilus assembly protein PilX